MFPFVFNDGDESYTFVINNDERKSNYGKTKEAIISTNYGIVYILPGVLILNQYRTVNTSHIRTLLCH